jgi:hypothetical protein
MPGKRKLFIMHAQELAHRLVHSIAHGGLVEQFVRSYAERHNRRKLTGDSLRLRELESTIGREALLAIAVEVRRLAPRAFAQGGSAPGPQEIALGETFFAEFVASLGRALDWAAADVPSEMRALERDLEMYWGWSHRSGAPPTARSRRRGSGSGSEGPFPDRCAILLDPPMMEQARRAAAAFETDVVREGIRAFDRLGRHHAGGPPRARHAAKKISRAARRPATRATRSLLHGGENLRRNEKLHGQKDSRQNENLRVDAKRRMKPPRIRRKPESRGGDVGRQRAKTPARVRGQQKQFRQTAKKPASPVTPSKSRAGEKSPARKLERKTHPHAGLGQKLRGGHTKSANPAGKLPPARAKAMNSKRGGGRR